LAVGRNAPCGDLTVDDEFLIIGAYDVRPPVHWFATLETDVEALVVDTRTSLAA
jgi:hypothetical protein